MPRTTEEALLMMKITAEDMLRFDVCHGIIAEAGAAQTAQNIKKFLLNALAALNEFPPETLVETRYRRYRNFGSWNTC